MLQKPEITKEQIIEFESLFKELITYASKEAQSIWEKEGEFIWASYEVKILPDGIENFLPPKYADKLVTAANREGILLS